MFSIKADSDGRIEPPRCRSCLKLDPSPISIFEEGIAFIFTELTSIQVLESDEISTVLCLPCQYQIKYFKQFKENCLASDNVLRRDLESRLAYRAAFDALAKDLSEPIDEALFEDPIENEPIKEEQDPDEKHVQTSPERFNCTDCSRKFNKELALKRHKILKHDYLKCRVCSKMFNSQEILQQHEERHATAQTCLVCGLKFENKAEKKSHEKSHITFRCNASNCEKEFSTALKLKTHNDRMHDMNREEGVFRCSICKDRWYKFERLLKEHQRVSHPKDAKDLFCDICQKKLATKRSLAKHRNRHFAHERKYKCETCEKSFADKDCLYAHRKIHNQESYIVCNFCGQRCLSVTNLKSHIIFKHSNERPFSCDICQRNFKTKAMIQKHMLVHVQERNFSCTKCGGKFKDRKSLLLHESRHDENRPKVPCTTCGSLFSTRNAMKTHFRSHTDERPYKCTMPGCQMAFRQRANLKKHTYSHTGTRPYNCLYCPTGYYQKAYLKNHVLRIHGIVMA